MRGYVKASPASLRASAKQREAWIVSSLGSSQMTRARYCSRKPRKNDFLLARGGANEVAVGIDSRFSGALVTAALATAVAGAPMGKSAGPAPAAEGE